MANGIFTVSKGSLVAFHENVRARSPADSQLIVVLLQAAVADADLVDFQNLAAVLDDAGVTECDFTNYARSTLSPASLAAPTFDNVADSATVTIPSVSFADAGGAVNNTVLKALVCYLPDDQVAPGTIDSTTIPMTHHDINFTTTGTTLIVTPSGAGYARFT